MALVTQARQPTAFTHSYGMLVRFRWQGHGPPFDMAFHPDGHLLVANTSKQTSKHWAIGALGSLSNIF